MLILIAFTALALLAAGTFAVLKGDTLACAALLVVLCLLALVAAPQVPMLMHSAQQTLDAALPLAQR